MRYHFTANVLVQIDLEPAILLDLQTGHYFEANASAHHLILGIQNRDPHDALLQRMIDAFRAPREQLEGDLSRLLEDWLKRGWIRASD